mmetsp:Transcript_16948/g.48692  ORF Transcript_16948/g.48692 Transcript_16948/m.48692 type:complete len:89 (-) Transcript_16948:1494-1760(-)
MRYLFASDILQPAKFIHLYLSHYRIEDILFYFALVVIYSILMPFDSAASRSVLAADDILIWALCMALLKETRHWKRRRLKTVLVRNAK